jgi:prepilin-type N-terminal cleavage/methylation domain-containing protein
MKRSKSTSVFDNRGFTLIEILIAISLLAFITIGVVTITQNAANTMERTTEINKNNLQIETALSRFDWDFSQIYSPLYFSTVLNISAGDPYGATNDGNLDGIDDVTGKQIKPTTPLNPELQDYYQRLIQRFEQNQHFSGVSKEGLPIPRFYSPEKNIFEFFTSSNRRKIQNMKQSHFAWVRYALGDPLPKDKDDEDKEKNVNIPEGLRTLVRYYNADDPYDKDRIDTQDDKIKAAVLLENVESLEFQFWNMTGRRWETSLRSIPGGENSLRGVKLLVTWYDSSGNKKSLTRIYRNHWPMEVPQDTPITPAPGTQTGTTQGGTNGGASTGGMGGSN